jgi:amino acid transporter
MLTRIKRLIIGEPLESYHHIHERLPKWKALALLSSDALSSVAYATEEMLIPLAAFSVGAMAWSIPVALAIAALLFILTVSHRQTIDAYPQGVGAYLVAKENLGPTAGLVAGAALLIDYIMTVAVSVAAGVAAITSAWPALFEHREGVALAVILMLMLLNLRGLRGGSTLVALPTYAFIFAVLALIGAGGWKLLSGEVPFAHPVVHESYPEVPLFLALRAFSGGCAALTGIEAISIGIPAFRDPTQRNAKRTMAWMSVILGGLFLGITLLAHGFGTIPADGETVISVLGRQIFGEGWIYLGLQAATALILILAANTAYQGFPRLASLLANDRYLPRQLASLGDKLVFSNGIVGLSLVALGLIAWFEGQTHRLIPLYAVGVFLSFTLSQAGMVVLHWRKRREKDARWRAAFCFNLVGAITTGVVLLVTGVTKFSAGAWVVILLVPAFVWVFMRVHAHYLMVGRELSLANLPAPPRLTRLKHTVIIPISGIHRGVLDAIRYGLSISDDVRACYVDLDPATTERVQADWQRWARNVPFVVLKSPYRSVVTPLLEYVNDVAQITHDDMITVIIPEFIPARWWHRLLHNQTAWIIRAALSFKRGCVVTSVRYHLKG